MLGTIKIIRITYLDSDIFEGSLPREVYDNAEVELFEVDDISEAVDVFRRHGVSFAATGNDWAADPDGSYVSNYSTGENVETTGHFEDDFPADAIAAVIAEVG